MYKHAIIIFSLLLTSLPIQALKLGDTAPNIFGRQTNDAMFALSREKGMPKVLNFFWVQCKPCKKELPLLSRKEKVYPNVKFIAVHAETNPATGSNYDIKDITKFINSLSAAPETVVLGSPLLKNNYAIKGFPSTILLNSNNQVVDIIVGFNAKTISRIEAWLKKQ